MIVFIACIITLLIAIGLLILFAHLQMRPKFWVDMIMGVACVIAISGFALGIINHFYTYNTNQRNQERYMDLAIYHEVVTESSNEVMRWHYYNRVQEWNNEYNHYLKMKDSPWIGFYYGDHDYDGCDFINMDLRLE